MTAGRTPLDESGRETSQYSRLTPVGQRLWSRRQVPALVFWLVVFAWRIRRRDWWKRPPFLPVPPKGYLRWRLELAYGDWPVRRRDLLIDVFNFAYALRQFERM